MSMRHIDGTQAAPRGDAEEFLLQLHRDWAGDDPARLRRLAAVTLYSHGWTMENIAWALGWRAKGHAARMVHSTLGSLRQHFAVMNPGATQDSSEIPTPAQLLDGDQYHLPA